MCRPFRLYSYSLARRYKMPLKMLYEVLSASDIMEEMAFDLTQSDDWIKEYKKDIERQQSKKADSQTRLLAYKRLFGDRKINASK